MADLDYPDYLEGTQKSLEQSALETKAYKTTVAGREFIVLPNVFSPKYFKDTELFAENLPVSKGAVMLEIGPGSGAVSITAVYRGAGNVVAVDINPDAVRNTLENIQLHHMEDRVEVRQGNLYDTLKENEKFDMIFWNTPFGYVEHEVSDLEKAVFDTAYRSTERFIKEAKFHLKENGKVFIGFSTTLGRFNLLQKFATEAGFSLKLVFRAESEETHPVMFEIFEAVRS